jgi:WhiB family redox-sensing transcriptional regulator
MTTGDWRAVARCRTADPDLFFHPDGERAGARTDRMNRAKQVCNACPVTRQCADHALDTREGFGVWGGMSEDERIGHFLAEGTRPRGRSVHLTR